VPRSPGRLVEEATSQVYNRTSRRGFLARTAGVLAAVGLGELAAAAPASAAPGCCSGTSCISLGLVCTCPTGCPSGYTYTGYTWACCLGARIYYCHDCRKNGGTSICVCGCAGPQPCNAAQTATELSRAHPADAEPAEAG